MIASIINATGVTIVIGTDTFTIRKDHVSYPSIITELNGNKDAATLRSLLDVKAAINTLTSGKVEIKDDKVFVNGEEVNTGLAKRIIQLVKDNKNGIAQPLVAFLENIMQNTSRRAVQGLYEWLEKSDLPITDDGHFIAWKIVGPNFMDLYSGKFDNSPGKVVEVARNEVDEDPNMTCSYGLHFCSSGYLPKYGTAQGNKVVMVKVHPADVVAFPQDYNTAKGRCCKYTVIKEVVREDCPTMFTGVTTVSARTSNVEGFYHDASGNLTLIHSDGTETKTSTFGNGDYDFETNDEGSIKLVPSGRIVYY